MPKLDMDTHKIGGTFTFEAARIGGLGATEYTLVTIAIDETGSVHGFENQLREMLVVAVDACKKSPRSDNLLLRVITFGSQHKNGVNEIHGFKSLAEIDTSDYPEIDPGGMTPLYDACYSAIGAMNAYGQKLVDDDFGVNAIAFIITDGSDNHSTVTTKMVKEEIERAVKGEIIESTISVLVGINTQECANELALFQKEVGISCFIDAGEATKTKLAKLADFVSQSVSSQSQALGTGGPSQNISATI